jgi:hypothetical protein
MNLILNEYFFPVYNSYVIDKNQWGIIMDTTNTVLNKMSQNQCFFGTENSVLQDLSGPLITLILALMTIYIAVSVIRYQPLFQSYGEEIATWYSENLHIKIFCFSGLLVIAFILCTSIVSEFCDSCIVNIFATFVLLLVIGFSILFIHRLSLIFKNNFIYPRFTAMYGSIHPLISSDQLKKTKCHILSNIKKTPYKFFKGKSSLNHPIKSFQSTKREEELNSEILDDLIRNAIMSSNYQLLRIIIDQYKRFFVDRSRRLLTLI